MKPLINDITTTPNDPPQFETIAKRLGEEMVYPPEFAPLQKAAYPDIGPVRLGMDSDQAFERMVQIAAAMPRWQIISRHDDKRKLEATAKTAVFRFKDDMVIEVRTDLDGKASLHLRSRSRVGRGDFGKNAERIREFVARFSDS